MSDVKLFLEKSRDLIGDSDFESVKDTLEALLRVNPDLVDSVFYDRISRLVDSARISKDTQAQVHRLSIAVDEQRKSMDQLSDRLKSMNDSFNRLHSQLVRDNEKDRQTRQKLNFVLDGLEQWLRRHS